jgi:apolipoprotein N-acyltransferase
MPASAQARSRDRVPDRGSAPSSGRARSLRAELALAALSGLLYVVAFPGIDQFYLAFTAFVPVAWAAREATPRRALLLGAVMGLVSHAIAYFWINHLLIEFAQAPWPLAALGWLGMCALQGASYGVGLALAVWLRRKTGWPFAITLAVGLTAMDFVYPLIFPSYVANTMAGATWMMQSADLLGVLGITALLAAINGAIVDVLIARQEARPWPRRIVGTVGGLWGAAIVYGAVRTAQVDARASAAPKLRVGLVQSNVGGMERMEDLPRTVALHQRLTRSLVDRGVDLVVWPEGAYGGIVAPGSNVSRSVLAGARVPLLFGGVRVGSQGQAHGQQLPFNSAFLADAQGWVRGYYDKIALLVFGEFIPLGDTFPVFYEWLPEASHWGRGTTTQPLILGDWRMGTFICYEDILPRLVQRIMEPQEGLRPNLMVNITNDSWYGRDKEQEEHLALASFRAVEHRRALVRSTNTGISALIDPAGRVVARTPKFVETTLTGEVPRMEGTTVYEVVGDVCGYAALLILAGAWVAARRKSAAASA